MGIFHKRPLAFSVCAAAGLALAVMSAGSRLKLILLACFLFCGLLLSVFSVLRRRVTARCTAGILTCAACACLLVGSWAWFGPASDRYLSRAGETVAVEGYVTERLSAGGNGSRFTVRLTEFDGTPVRDRVLLSAPTVPRFPRATASVLWDRCGNLRATGRMMRKPPCARMAWSRL